MRMILVGALLLLGTGHLLAGEAEQLAGELGGPDAVKEQRVAERLTARGDAATAALGSVANNGASLPSRMMAVELLGRIGTESARTILVQQLRTERHLAVRGQLCMQLGSLREKRAVPVVGEWLKTIGPGKLNDVTGPKEIQPSTCYIRHVEALGMIGDEAGLAMLDDFEKRLPAGVGVGGFVTNFVLGAVREAREEIRSKVAFRASMKDAGAEEKARRVLEHLRADPVARFRMHDDEVIRRTATGRAVLEELARGQDKPLAEAAAAILANWTR